ncbi:MAG: DUF309 domain-containing protein [Sumerlaeia bacterium]
MNNLAKSRPPIDSPIPFPEQYAEFFILFNARKYFDAHEVLEDLWIMETGEEKNYYKGLIMLVIALEHLCRGNLAPAMRLHRDAKAYLFPYAEYYMGFQLKAFITTVNELIVQSEKRTTETGKCTTNLQEHPTLRIDVFHWT